MKRIFITFTLAVGACFAALAVSSQAGMSSSSPDEIVAQTFQDANQDDGGANVGGKRFFTDSTIVVQKIDFQGGNARVPNGIGGSKKGPRDPMDVAPWNPAIDKAPVVNPSDNASGDHSAVGSAQGDITTVAAPAEVDLGGKSMEALDGGSGRLNRTFVVHGVVHVMDNDIPALPDGVGGRVVSDGPKPNTGSGSVGGQPTKPARNNGNNNVAVAPAPQKEMDQSVVSALVGRILDGDKTSSIGDVSSLIDSMLER